jgi:hypothetical protein
MAPVWPCRRCSSDAASGVAAKTQRRPSAELATTLGCRPSARVKAARAVTLKPSEPSSRRRSWPPSASSSSSLSSSSHPSSSQTVRPPSREALLATA